MLLPGPLYESLLVYCPLYDAYRLPGAAAVTLPRKPVVLPGRLL